MPRGNPGKPKNMQKPYRDKLTTRQLTYYPDDGLFVRSKHKINKDGSIDPVPIKSEVLKPTVNTQGYLQTMHSGKVWLLHHAAWMHHHRTRPPTKMLFVDGNRQNLKIDNLIPWGWRDRLETLEHMGLTRRQAVETLAGMLETERQKDEETLHSLGLSNRSSPLERF